MIYKRSLDEMIRRENMKDDETMKKISHLFKNIDELDSYALWFLIHFDNPKTEEMKAFFGKEKKIK